MKRQITALYKIFANPISNNVLVFRKYKEHLKFTKRNQTIQLKNGEKI